MGEKEGRGLAVLRMVVVVVVLGEGGEGVADVEVWKIEKRFSHKFDPHFMNHWLIILEGPLAKRSSKRSGRLSYGSCISIIGFCAQISEWASSSFLLV